MDSKAAPASRVPRDVELTRLPPRASATVLSLAALRAAAGSADSPQPTQTPTLSLNPLRAVASARATTASPAPAPTDIPPGRVPVAVRNRRLTGKAIVRGEAHVAPGSSDRTAGEAMAAVGADGEDRWSDDGVEADEVDDTSALPPPPPPPPASST